MARVRVLPDQLEFDSRPDESFLQGSLRAGAPHVHACGGNARCSTCRIALVEGAELCGPQTPAEVKLTQRLHLSREIRLACQTRIPADVSGTVVARRLVLDDQDIELTDTEFETAAPGSVGDERKLAILFADVRNFTAHSEALPPYDIIHLLNRYFLQMGRVVDQHRGTINTYMGDGFMALFGLTGSPTPALDAVKAGLAMRESVFELQKYVASAYQREFQIGIGIHYGEAVVGRIGSEKSRAFTAIGDSVNFASRVESANKEAGTDFLISENTYAEVADQIEVGRHFTVPLKGKVGEFRLYEVRGLRPTP